MLRAYGLEIPQTLEEACTPSRTALIVYDMQVGILRQLRHGAAVTAKVAQVLRAARDGGVRVIFTRHLSLPRELMGMFFPVVVTDACGAGHEDAGQRALASIRFMGDALFTTAEEIGRIFPRPEQ